MKKILLPLEETERSLKSLHYVRKHHSPETAELVLMMVDESLGYSIRSEAEAAAIKELDEKLDMIAATLSGFRISKIAAAGKAGVRITRAAREIGADLIVMTKSSKEDMLSSIGTTAEYVINNASCDVVIVSEQTGAANEYRGLVYRTAKGVVNLRGQLGDKQSECLLPSVNQDCIYHIDVTVGKIRFFHTAYNPETRNWDLPPLPGQDLTLDIAAGESRYIYVKADSTEGKADRIRIVNRDMKKEAVFRFRITAAEFDENGNIKIPAEPAPEKQPLSRSTIGLSRADIQAQAAAEAADRIPENFEAPEVPDFAPAAAEEAGPVETAPAGIVVEEIRTEKPEDAEKKTEGTVFTVEIRE